MGDNIAVLWEVREARIDKDSEIAKRLMREAIRASDQLVSILNIWNREIKDPEQLVALTTFVRKLAYDTIVDRALDIEVDRNLDKISVHNKIEE